MLDLDVIIRDIRTFSGRHVIPVRPLTIAIGENSSGKSTFLAVLSALLDSSGFPFRPALNRPPFDLGGFDNILTSMRKNGQRPMDFAIGLNGTTKGGAGTHAVATYSGSRGQVQLSTFLLQSGLGSLDLTVSPKAIKGVVRLKPDERHPNETEVNIDFESPPAQVDLMSTVIMGIFQSTKTETTRSIVLDVQARLYHLVSTLMEIWQQPVYSLAPIRTKPKRTYDQVTDSFSPEGDHIPILLSRIFSDDDKKEVKASLRQALAKFGYDSGLFKNVGLRRLGMGPSDPFQVKVMMGGRVSNLTDVGYGVSQALPVVVESIIGSESRVLLLQQPEVHLHPRAQAALGTFFVDLVSSKKKQFVIETHSDYLIDRVRQEIASKRLIPEMVSFLFFERTGGSTRVHKIELDELGNLTNPPKRYRKFFLTEKRKLLTRGK